MRHNAVGKVGYSKNRNKIDTAYREYLKGYPSSEDVFFKAVIEFAKVKIKSSLFDTNESKSTVEDHAQDVAIKVWSHLNTFNGGPEKFYPWLHRVCFTQGIDAFNEVKGEAEGKVDMFVEDATTGLMEDNPEVYASGVSYKQNGKQAYHIPSPQYQRELPEFIQDTDLKICMYIRADKTYSQIADLLETTEKAVELRVARMRKKIEEMKNA